MRSAEESYRNKLGVILMLEKIPQQAIDVIQEKVPQILDLFMPGVQNIVMNKRLENAERAIATIKERLAKYGLQVDYRRYFEEKLQVPLMEVQGLSEVETDDQRALLQNLFIRHLTGSYSNDAFYPSFIAIIKTLTPLEIKILQRSYEYLKERNLWYTSQTEYEPLELPRQALKQELGISDIEIKAVIKNLERNFLLFSGGGDCMYLTALGILFINACVRDALTE